jgi:hypothetical protein
VAAFAPLGSLSPPQWLAAHAGTRSLLAAPLPPNVHLATARQNAPGELLLRLAHTYDAGEDAAGRAGPSRAPLPIADCTDVNGIPPETWPALRGLDTLVLDMLRERAHPTHFTLAEALSVAERVGARRTVFTHMTHDIRQAGSRR